MLIGGEKMENYFSAKFPHFEWKKKKTNHNKMKNKLSPLS
jgi:hypothetical protein